jgi:hypothetical protein
MKALLTIILLVLPFQIVGAIAYFRLAKNDRPCARTTAAVLPAASFFILFLGLFGWNYFKPGILMLGDGAINQSTSARFGYFDCFPYFLSRSRSASSITVLKGRS